MKSLHAINIDAEGKAPIYPVDYPIIGHLPSDSLQNNRDLWGGYIVSNHWPISIDKR